MGCRPLQVLSADAFAAFEEAGLDNEAPYDTDVQARLSSASLEDADELAARMLCAPSAAASERQQLGRTSYTCR